MSNVEKVLAGAILAAWSEDGSAVPPEVRAARAALSITSTPAEVTRVEDAIRLGIQDTHTMPLTPHVVKASTEELLVEAISARLTPRPDRFPMLSYDEYVDSLARRLYTSRGHDFDTAPEWVQELHRDYARTAMGFLPGRDQ